MAFGQFFGGLGAKGLDGLIIATPIGTITGNCADFGFGDEFSFYCTGEVQPDKTKNNPPIVPKLQGAYY